MRGRGLHVSHLPGLKPIYSVWRNTSVIRAKSKDGDGEGGVIGPVVQEDDSGGSTLVNLRWFILVCPPGLNGA